MMNFINNLSNKLNIIMEAKPGEITDNLYQSYIKYHGKLNALPQKELTVKELTDPRSGHYFPIESWPTKSTREASSKIWTDYNTKIQTPEAEPASIDMCSDPDQYLQNALNDCLKSGQEVAKWDRETAEKKCNLQINKLKQELDKYCGDK